MKRFALLAPLVCLVAVVPATAAKPTHPAHPGHPAHPTHPSGGGSAGKGSCASLSKGFYGKGELVSGTLSAATRKDRYDGTLTVALKRANHRAPTGSQTFKLTNARVRFGKGVSKTALAAGDWVVLHGQITALPHGCSSTGFTPTVTVRYLAITTAKH